MDDLCDECKKKLLELWETYEYDEYYESKNVKTRKICSYMRKLKEELEQKI
jgi:hypothetical protein